MSVIESHSYKNSLQHYEPVHIHIYSHSPTLHRSQQGKKKNLWMWNIPDIIHIITSSVFKVGPSLKVQHLVGHR
jgi:hypothetical protein